MKINGKIIFRKSAKGQRANPFFHTGVEKGSDMVAKIFQSAADSALRKLARAGE